LELEKNKMDDFDFATIIYDEILVDTYSTDEVASAWYSYMEDHMSFPFMAECLFESSLSPFKKGELFEVVELGEIESCDHEVYVKISFCNRQFDIPLLDMKPTDATKETVTAIRCWYHWVSEGNQY